MRYFLSAVTLFLLILSRPVMADIILMDDFQDGKSDGWQAMGKGDVRLTEYKKNISLYLSHHVMVVTAFSTKGYDKVAVALSFAAKSLEEGEYCIAEVSGDKGQSWHEINKVGDGQDDAISLHMGSVSSEDLNDKAKVYIRVRITGNKDNDICWLDNVRVTGRKIRVGADNPHAFPAEALRNGTAYDRPVDMSAFAPVNAVKASPFEGKVTFDGGRIKGFEALKDDYGYGRGGKVARMPSFAVDFVSSGSDLIPLRRGLILSENPQWDIILEPGKIWRESGETGFSRAAIPFALQEKNANCTHNGVMTFLYDEKAITSQVAVQISSETCLYFKFDLWGYSKATYSPASVTGSAGVIEAYGQEKAARLPVKPIHSLAQDYPGVNPYNFGSVAEVNPDDMTVYGLLVDGTHYVGGCETRYGAYPYCDVLDLPSYSTAKSLFAGLALMRMEKLYPGVGQEKIADYIPACKKSGNWADVTFQDALNMTTGNYATDKYMADEGGQKMIRFFDAVSHKDKIKAACGAFKRQSRPGKKWVYHTSDTYILGTAMQNYLAEKGDLYDDILKKTLWAELRLSPVLNTTRRTPDKRAQPFTGYGLTYHRNDLVRLVAFLNSDKELAADFFDKAEFDKAMQRNRAARGMAAYGKAVKYQNGFWASNFQKTLGCKSPIWIPFMSGYGGITVALLPNDMIYYYFSDNDDFAWKKAVLEAGKIKNICK